MAESQETPIKSPIIMKVDGPTDENIEQDDDSNERTEDSSSPNSINDIKPSQICSPNLARPILSASRLGWHSSNAAASGSILKPSQLGSAITNSNNTSRSFLLSPSRLNPFTKAPGDVERKDESKVSQTNGETPKFFPLLNTENNTVKTVAKPSTSNLTNNVPSSQASNFVFGQNLEERVIAEGKADSKPEESKPSTSINANGTSDMLFTSAMSNSDVNNLSNRETKTLSESAREYEESRAVKRKYDEVEIKTGEEGETNIAQMSCKLFSFDKNSGSWQERGRGTLRLNDKEVTDDNESYTQSRLVFRTSGSLRVILNTKIWADMTIQEASTKSIRLTAIDSNGEIKVFLIMANKDEVKHLYELLDVRVKKEIERQRHKGENQDKPAVEESLESCEKKPNVDTGED